MKIITARICIYLEEGGGQKQNKDGRIKVKSPKKKKNGRGCRISFSP
jgi:hypothetical protein